MSNSSCECLREYGVGLGVGICYACGKPSCDKFWGCYNILHGEECKNRKGLKI